MAETTPSSSNKQDPNGNTGFLPDFCAPPILLLLVLAAQLLAFLLALARSQFGQAFWVDLGVISLFLQWIALVSAAVICALRAPLGRLPRHVSAALAYLALVTTTFLLSLLAWFLAEWSGLGGEWTPDSPWFFLLRNTAISAIVSAVALRYFYIQYQWKHNIQREAEARVEALQARIRPHFLFNSLNTVAALIAVRPEIAERAVEDLSDLFRASLSDAGDGVTLKEEMELAERYLHLEALRLDERLKLHWDVPESAVERVRVPRLIIQPLVENAVYHGIETRPEGGDVEVVARGHEDHVEITIRNPLPDSDDRPTARKGHQMALDNVTQRLKLRMGPKASLQTERGAEEFLTRLRLPRESEG
ncbi:sensor histidine kinase [Gammaproteobacteria bacterium AB-CW1]|uniref:Sensor histidine kinase n=1 Tax=Natronospira elongata TaxID=3110268 RepID=A0AAP6JDI0_9GAMM|nr:sensor histidine kinase [Gammaproteobacteria bacterium AB-CW1]